MPSLKSRIIKIEAAIGGTAHADRVFQRIGVKGIDQMIAALEAWDGEGEFDPPEPVRTWFEQVRPFMEPDATVSFTPRGHGCTTTFEGADI